jgi:hypothetical protein
MLYAENKNKVRLINGEALDFEMDVDKGAKGEPARNPELLFNMKEEIGIPDISTFLLNSNIYLKVIDQAAELPDILNMPLRLYRDDN